MARRRELQGLCNNLLFSFISRNNDINGYWGLGVHALALKKSRTEKIQISLIRGRTLCEPWSETQIYYSNKLHRAMALRGFPTLWLGFAEISLEVVGESLLSCRVNMVSDLGRGFKSETKISVRSHDPARELRRQMTNWAIRTHF